MGKLSPTTALWTIFIICALTGCHSQRPKARDTAEDQHQAAENAIIVLPPTSQAGEDERPAPIHREQSMPAVATTAQATESSAVMHSLSQIAYMGRVMKNGVVVSAGPNVELPWAVPRAGEKVEISAFSIIKIAHSIRGEMFAQEFIDSLNQDREALVDAINPKTGPETQERLAAEIEEDLRIKELFFSRAQPASSSTEPGTYGIVTVIAHTTRESKEENGCEVWYVKAAFEKKPDEYRRFERISSPTRRKLAVGNYVMWSKKDDNRGERVKVSVGTAGDLLQDVDLAVPKP